MERCWLNCDVTMAQVDSDCNGEIDFEELCYLEIAMSGVCRQHLEISPKPMGLATVLFWRTGTPDSQTHPINRGVTHQSEGFP